MRARAVAVDHREPPLVIDWPVDTIGNSNVPRVGDDVVMPDGSYWAVRNVQWYPLGDEHDPAPSVAVILRPRA